MAQSSIPSFAAAATSLAVSTTSSNTTITAPSGQTCSTYYVMNISTVPVWCVITNTPNPVATAPSAGSPQPGFSVPPNMNILVSGPACGNGQNAYLAAIASASGNIAICPCHT